ncbi:MAG: flagellar assembly protein FliW [Rhodospirillaceae bacterium]|nr:flagellar assembly protein FliW [Rhodospirillaceae bacterium]
MTALSPAPMPARALSSAALPPSESSPDKELLVNTRFGVVAVQAGSVIDMPQGPLGFTQHRRFVLIELPNPKLAPFRLLQSLSDAEVSFVVTPLRPESGLIDLGDIEEACNTSGFSVSEALVLLIVTVRQEAGRIVTTVNLRAPVVLDPNRRVARQVVLANPDYAVRHPL